ncbi:MAG: type III-B CRISPR-associated protein Cas10/Cmr2 [Bacteroidota bacterium]
MSNYLALTLGPIYRTLGDARKVRHLWGGSFLFSYLMKQIIKRTDVHQNKVFIRRLPEYNASATHPSGVGLFPDRLMLEVVAGQEKTAHDTLRQCIQQAIDATAGLSAMQKQGVIQYLQAYSLQMAVPDTKQADGTTVKGNYVQPLNQALDGIEQQSRAGGVEFAGLAAFLDNAREAFYLDATGSKKRIRFETLAEISAADLLGDQSKLFLQQYHEGIDLPGELDFFVQLLDWEKELNPELKSTPAHWRQFHKYIAIVHADGDNIGAALKEIGHDDVKIAQLSTCLFSFSQKAADLINNSGAMPIYAGGDDLLFIAPVAVGSLDGNVQTIFHLLQQLSALFDAEVSQKLDFFPEDAPPSLSFGLSISYYKFPLAESLETSRNQLNDTAKKAPGKNSIAFRVQKHSGSDFGAVLSNKLNMPEGLWMQMLDLQGAGKKDFLRSVAYTLESNAALVTAVLENAPAQLEHFFFNHFNEAVHRQEPAKSFLDDVQKLLQSFRADAGNAESAVKQVLALLLFLHFINSEFQTDERD